MQKNESNTAAPPDDVPRLVSHPVEIRGQLREMEGDLHHSELHLSNQDRCAGEIMAHEIGDLYIDHFNESPNEQWSKVMRALRAHGYEISFPANDQSLPPAERVAQHCLVRRWSYSSYRASLRLDGKPFAIVTPDGRNALSEDDQKTLIDALNSQANAKGESPATESEGGKH